MLECLSLGEARGYRRAGATSRAFLCPALSLISGGGNNGHSAMGTHQADAGPVGKLLRSDARPATHQLLPNLPASSSSPSHRGTASHGTSPKEPL